MRNLRLGYQPIVPQVFEALADFAFYPSGDRFPTQDNIQALFPHTAGRPVLKGGKGKLPLSALRVGALKVGALFSGGPAPGGHNVLTGLLDALERIHLDARLFGFLDGPAGMIAGKYKELTRAVLDPYRNQGGFDCIGTGRTKIQTQEQLHAIKGTVEALKMDGIVIIGGDDSNTNAAVLAEFFLKEGCPCKIIGVPKTIDGDLKNPYVPVSFGFDTACKTYAEMIGNLARDALSTKNYYHIIRLMGRAASHITLECALLTQPNLAFIGEEIAAEKWTLAQCINAIVDLVIARAKQGKYYGIILIPEGLIEFIPELPQEVQAQLELPRDPHGNVQLSAVETEKLCIKLVEQELKKRQFTGPFKAIPHFFGYEGRSAFPSNFDCTYCTALGFSAAVCIASGLSGYMCSLQQLQQAPRAWQTTAIPLTGLMDVQIRSGKENAVIRRGFVDLQGPAFKSFKQHRSLWALEDRYQFPGPIQFGASPEVSDRPPLSLLMEAHA